MILPLPRRTLPAALLLLLLGACAPEADRAEAPGAAQDGTLDLSTATAVSLARRLADGSLSAEALTRAYLDRIARLDDAEDGPQLNAVVELNPEALAIARGLDEALAADGPVGPLHGLPVLLKANIDTGDAMATHAGSLALADHHASEDAHHVALLRQAGAVILGKTNLSEWANFRDSRSTSGWSSVGGQTRNPYVLDRNPCGSSSGSAVAVAASLAALAVGTETDGSIVCPAGINGIVGIKPTLGIVSRHGIIPIAHSQDTAGPMAKTVTGAAMLLAAMAGRDERDAGSRAFKAGTALLPDPEQRRLDGLRIGVLRECFGAGELPPVEAVYAEAQATLEALGATLVDPITVETGELLRGAEFEVLLYEFKADLEGYLASHEVADDVDSLDELIAFNRAHAGTVMPIFGQSIFEAAAAKGGLEEPAYREALANNNVRMREQLAAVFAEHDLDALLVPANAPAWKTDWLLGDRYLLGSSALAAISGYPSVAVPAGYVSGLPVGVAFVGQPLSEAGLIQTAYAFEQGRPVRQEPEYRPTLER